MVFMKAVAWGYVTRDNGNGKEVLVTERYKEDDPLRSGQLAIPGGKLGPSEWYHQAAIREVLEETGIETELEDSGKHFVVTMDIARNKGKRFSQFFC